MEKRLSCVVLTPQDGWFRVKADKLLRSIRSQGHVARAVHEITENVSGDICFILSWESLVKREFRSRFAHCVVVHASDLPTGRGWSPLTWQILEGRTEIPITLFEAVDAVDAGPIYLKSVLQTAGHELLDELRSQLGDEIERMCLRFVDMVYGSRVVGVPQEGSPSFYPKRTPEDSRLDPDRTIRQQFDLLRVVDNERYPAFFEINGMTYQLKISRRGDSIERSHDATGEEP